MNDGNYPLFSSVVKDFKSLSQEDFLQLLYPKLKYFLVADGGRKDIPNTWVLERHIRLSYFCPLK